MFDVMALTRDLVRLDTTNPPGNEDPAIDLVAQALRGANFETKQIRFAGGRSNLIARRKGVLSGPGIGFTGHVDTVPIGTIPWQRDPFACTESEGRIYGRGVTDMKAGVAAMVAAAVNTAKDDGFLHDLTFVVTAGEECGCEGALALQQSGLKLPKLAGWVVGEPTANKIALGHKGAIFFRFEWTGRTAHSSMPHFGDNAIYKASEFALKVRDLKFSCDPHPTLGTPTKNVGLIQGGHAVNAVPDRAWLSVDVRTIPGMTRQAVQDQLQNLAGADATITVTCDFPAIWTDGLEPLVERTCVALESVGLPAGNFIGMPFFTDASVLAAISTAPVVVIGPGEPTQAHKTDEWCCIEEIHQAVSIYEHLMRNPLSVRAS